MAVVGGTRGAGGRPVVVVNVRIDGVMVVVACCRCAKLAAPPLPESIRRTAMEEDGNILGPQKDLSSNNQ